jgi:hypothetical protein
MSTGRVGCHEVEELAPEFALGTLSGVDRADVVAHLASCSGCQRQVEELTRTVDSVLLLAPEEDPSPGLEARVLASTVGEPVRAIDGGRRGKRLLWASIAAALIGAVAFAVFGRDDGYDTLRTAVAVEDGGRSICRAVLNEVDPAWLFVSLDEPGEDGSTYDVEVRFEDGGSRPVGRLDVRDGHGVLAITLDLGEDRVSALQLIDAGGEPGYEVRFH